MFPPIQLYVHILMKTLTFMFYYIAILLARVSSKNQTEILWTRCKSCIVQKMSIFFITLNLKVNFQINLKKPLT